ncbi:hypothetical protein IGI04_024942 [Brassica rapa subsp. trilocularis]|uniref:WRKY domain-containing protein n=1 Tax=Brassica rapa subsp. trilocularis TaxID=1813537 RepID=A0ABQ7MBM6_BRACM|nr:hypothetical protein IGI04_024942 [Brassica rapa subsp. trilocularis]
MADKEEQEVEHQQKQPLTSKSSTGGSSRPTISLPPRPFGEMFFSGGLGFSPGPMTLVSNLFSDPDELKTFSQLLAGAMASPVAAVVATAHQTPVSSVGGSGGDVDPRFKQNRPTGLMIAQPPAMFTVPPGLSPATLLDSPSFFGLFSPIQGSFGMTHQQALAQVTAQAVQGNTSVQSQSEHPSSTQQQQETSSEPMSQLPAPAQRDTVEVSVYEHRSSQPQSADKPADDGYNWRKYGQKQVKGSDFPRSYYKCTHPACPVKKKVERSQDGQVTEIIYKGQHSHEPPQNKTKRDNNGSSRSSDVATQFQTSNTAGLNKNKRDQETSQVTTTTTEQMCEASDSEETSVEPDPKRRSYYKCTTPGCGVRKHVERAANDPKAVVTTYEGKHNHDVPAARNSSHQLRPNNNLHNTTMDSMNQEQRVARLRLKEEQIT